MSGQPIAVRDVETDARFARDVAESTHYVPTSILAAPLFDEEGEAAGVLSRCSTPASTSRPTGP